MENVQYYNCLQYGHIARNCWFSPNNHCRNQRNNNKGNQQRNNNNQRHQGNPPPNNVGNWGINMLLIPPVREYDIVSDIWNTHAHVTMGELLANNTYREELRTALNTVGNRQPVPQNRQI